MLRGPVELAAADSWGRVLTVVVGPPAPPFVLYVTVNVRMVELVVIGCSPPIYRSISLFWSAFAGSSWMVGVGDAVMTVAANKNKVVESFMMRALYVCEM
jgi:Na+-translocating ferredoxin:NAD+ oxidoreductase RnfA subunit